MDKLDINIDELKSNIDKHVNSMINEYLQKKILRFIRDMSVKHNIEYDELVTHFNVCSNTDFKTEKPNNATTCRGITKTGSMCTHKCLSGSIYCKKHMKKNETIPKVDDEQKQQDSFFPVEECVR